MNKWEYMYIVANRELIIEVNGKSTGEAKGILKTFEGQPSISTFLENSGQEGWEVAGMCPATNDAHYWRMILKREI